MRLLNAVLLLSITLAACLGSDLAYDDEELSLEVAAVNSTACSNEYVRAGKGCVCKAGFGSYVPAWKTDQYPVTAPSCRLFTPGNDTLYNSSITFPPAGQGAGRCFCFRCPSTHTSTGGFLNSSGAACTPRLPTVLLSVNYTLIPGALGNSSGGCASNLTSAAVVRLRSAIRQLANVTARATTGCTPVPTSASLRLSVRLTYAGNNARQAFPSFASVAKSINSNRCAYGVCNGLRAVSRGAVNVTAAAAATRSSGFTVTCSPPNCDDRACQTGRCSTGVCSYTDLEDGTACTDGPVTGKCQTGVCVGMKANIDAAAQGQTEPVIFKARFASTAGLNGATQVVLHGRKGNATDGIGDELGILYDDGQRVHDDRYAGDGLFSNVIFIDFPKTNEAVYRNFYVSLLDKDVSSQVIITAITTDFDVFVQIFPTAELITTAQQRLEEIQSTGATPEQATQQMYDLLLQLTGSNGQRRLMYAAASAAGPQQQDLSVFGKIKNGTVRQVTERRIEFLTEDNFPCFILATDNYGKSCSRRRSSRLLLHSGIGQQQTIDLHTAQGSSDSGSLTQQVQQLLLQQQAADLQDTTAATSSSSNIGHPSDTALHFPQRQLLQDQESKKCPTGRGSVLILAPYLREFRCAFGDEAADIASLFGAAGYNVIFKCNDLGLCPAGPPVLDDYEGWSRHAFVVVSSIGDDNADGDTPIIMSGASLDFQNTNHILDWQANRMALTADGRFALRPNWFQKYRDAASATPSRTIVFFSSDRSAMPTGSAAEQEQRGFPGAFWGMAGSASYAGYTNYLSRSFTAGSSPGVAMAKHLLKNGTVASYPGTSAADQLTGAVFKSYAFRPGAYLFDRCAANCGDVRCNEDEGEVCNTLTGTCDIKCDGKADGTRCKLRGFESKCADGACEDLCKSAVCQATACQELQVPEGSLCPPAVGECDSTNKTAGTTCDYSGIPGACSNGICARLYTIYYRVEGPITSFPSPLSSTTALSSFSASVGSSMSFPATYSTSNIQTSVIKTLPNTRRSTISSSGSATAAAVTPKVTNTQAVVFMSQFPESKELSLEIEFLLLASAALMSLTSPYGPGLSVQRSDANGNILDLVDYCIRRQQPCVPSNPCQNATCVPRTGECAFTDLPDGTACSVNGSANGTCSASVCSAPATVCSGNPCGKVQFAVNGSCSASAKRAGVQQQQQNYTCACVPGYTWSGGACIAIACSGNPCGKIQFAVNGSCSASARRAGVQQQQQLNYTCACVPRYTWSEGACIATTCVNKPCSSIPNTLLNSCSDAPGSINGFQCGCFSGLVWSDTYSACTSFVCAADPCSSTRFAVDKTCVATPGLGFGYSCSCLAGYVWDSLSGVCKDFCAEFSGTQCRAVNCNATAFSIGYSPINEGGSCTLPNNNPGICNSGNCNAIPPTPSPSPSPSPSGPSCNTTCATAIPPTVCQKYGGFCTSQSSSCQFTERAVDAGCSLGGGFNGYCTLNDPGLPNYCIGFDRGNRYVVESSAPFNRFPRALTSRQDDGSVYYTTYDNKVRKVTLGSTAAGPDGATLLTDDQLIASFDAATSNPGSLRGIAFDDRQNQLYVADYDQNCVRMIDFSGPTGATSPAISEFMGRCESSSPCESTPGAYGCATSYSDDASSQILWGPTDVEIIYTETCDPSSGSCSQPPIFYLFVTDSKNGCVRFFSTPVGLNPPFIDTYQPTIFGACGAQRDLFTVAPPTYVAGGKSGLSAEPVVFVAYTDGRRIKWRDTGGQSGTFRTDDERGRYCKVSDLLFVPPSGSSFGVLMACDNANAIGGTGGVYGSFGVLRTTVAAGVASTSTILPLMMGGGNNTMLDPYITRASGLARIAVLDNTIWIADGGRLGGISNGLDAFAPIPPGFTAVKYTDPPKLNLRFNALYAGSRYTCGQRYDSQQLHCWGERGDWLLTSEPDTLGVAAVGKQHVCYQVIQASVPRVVCFGQNNFGQLDPPPQLNGGGSSVEAKQMCAGQFHTCAMTAGGNPRLRCWGRWAGVSIDKTSLPLGDNAVNAIGCGASHVCAMMDGNLIFCTGGSGACGAKCKVPSRWGVPDGAVKIVGGVDHTCALSTGDSVVCWGNNTYGQLEVPTPGGNTIDKIIDIAAGDYFTCAISKDAQVFCWGKDTAAGQSLEVPTGLGLGALGGGVIQITAGPDHACVRKDNGQSTCWGYCDTGACNIPRPLAPN